MLGPIDGAVSLERDLPQRSWPSARESVERFGGRIVGGKLRDERQFVAGPQHLMIGLDASGLWMHERTQPEVELARRSARPPCGERLADDTGELVHEGYGVAVTVAMQP